MKKKRESGLHRGPKIASCLVKIDESFRIAKLQNRHGRENCRKFS